MDPATWYAIGVGVVAAIKWLFGWLTSSALKQVGLAIRDGLVALGKNLLALAKDIANRFVDAYKWLRKFWSKAVVPLFKTIYKRAIQLSALLKRWFKPLVDWIQKARKYILQIYKDWISPILKVFDVLKRTLDLLALFGVSGAKKLAQRLQELENKISYPFEFVLSKLNEVIGYINLVIGLDGLLNRFTLFRSLLAYKRDVTGTFLQLMHRPLTPTERLVYDSPPLWVKTPEQHIADMKSFARTGKSSFSGAAEEWGGDLLRLIGES